MPLLEPRFKLRNYGFEPVADAVRREARPWSTAVQATTPSPSSDAADVDRWGVTSEAARGWRTTIFFEQTNREQRLACEPRNGTELCGWASGDGYDATRMIVPGLRRQIEKVYDGDPAMYAVPTENVFVALPFDLATRRNTERLLKTKVEHDFTVGDNPVSPELFVERDGQVVVFRA